MTIPPLPFVRLNILKRGVFMVWIICLISAFVSGKTQLAFAIIEKFKSITYCLSHLNLQQQLSMDVHGTAWPLWSETLRALKDCSFKNRDLALRHRSYAWIRDLGLVAHYLNRLGAEREKCSWWGSQGAVFLSHYYGRAMNVLAATFSLPILLLDVQCAMRRVVSLWVAIISILHVNSAASRRSFSCCTRSYFVSMKSFDFLSKLSFLGYFDAGIWLRLELVGVV